MNSSLADVKKSLKQVVDAGKNAEVSIEEFGEGYNVYFTIFSGEGKVIEGFTMSDEEKKSQAISRAKRIEDSINKLGVPIKNLGITTW